ncbi:MAG: hypothetical protein AB1599_04555, partial [Planctomycetota bacterium]
MTSQVIVVREGSIAEEALAHQFDFNLWFQEQLHSTPWWLASLIFHALLILMLASIPPPDNFKIPDMPVIIPTKVDEPPDVTTIPPIEPVKPLDPENTQTVETNPI